VHEYLTHMAELIHLFLAMLDNNMPQWVRWHWRCRCLPRDCSQGRTTSNLSQAHSFHSSYENHAQAKVQYCPLMSWVLSYMVPAIQFRHRMLLPKTAITTRMCNCTECDSRDKTLDIYTLQTVSIYTQRKLNTRHTFHLYKVFLKHSAQKNIQYRNCDVTRILQQWTNVPKCQQLVSVIGTNTRNKKHLV
jgi:hypothetical protein